MNYHWLNLTICYCVTDEGKFFAYDRLKGITKYFSSIKEAMECAEDWLLQQLKEEEKINKMFRNKFYEFH